MYVRVFVFVFVIAVMVCSLLFAISSFDGTHYAFFSFFFLSFCVVDAAGGQKQKQVLKLIFRPRMLLVGGGFYEMKNRDVAPCLVVRDASPMLK